LKTLENQIMGGVVKKGRTVFVSFSGIDGSGKSTQIDALSSRLRQEGLRVESVRFWDDVARLKGIRETSGHKIFKGDKGVGSPEAPIERRDKNVQTPFMTPVRLFLYSVDAISQRLAVRKALRSGADFVIFDRYTYDELANLNMGNPLIRAYIRLLMVFVPRPHVSYLLDADPMQARARKPEYPLNFLYTNRQRYMTLNSLIGGITVISPNPVAEVSRQVLAHAMKHLSGIAFKNGGEVAKLENPQTRAAAS
jgi:thymidylate kinase